MKFVGDNQEFNAQFPRLGFSALSVDLYSGDASPHPRLLRSVVPDGEGEYDFILPRPTSAVEYRLTISARTEATYLDFGSQKRWVTISIDKETRRRQEDLITPVVRIIRPVEKNGAPYLPVVDAYRHVLFATDRLGVDLTTSVLFTNQRNPDKSMSFGRALADQRALSSSSQNDPSFMLNSRSQFLDQWRSLLNVGKSHDGTLFLHGYKTSFSSAFLETTRLVAALKFDGPAVAFSWPSKDRYLGYVADLDNTDWSQRDFQQLLQMLLSSPELHRLHIIAHSMGNRVLMSVINETTLTQRQRAKVGQIIMAAPDVDRDIFGSIGFKKFGAERFTLYASSGDWPIWAGSTLRGIRRAGDASAGIEIVDGVDSVDVSRVDDGNLLKLLVPGSADPWGHSYFESSRAVVGDIFALIRFNMAPDSRFGLVQDNTERGVYWYFRP